MSLFQKELVLITRIQEITWKDPNFRWYHSMHGERRVFVSGDDCFPTIVQPSKSKNCKFLCGSNILKTRISNIILSSYSTFYTFFLIILNYSSVFFSLFQLKLKLKIVTSPLSSFLFLSGFDSWRWRWRSCSWGSQTSTGRTDRASGNRPKSVGGIEKVLALDGCRTGSS